MKGLAAALLASCACMALADDFVINVNHRAGSVTPESGVEVAVGDTVYVRVYETKTGCFTYNAEAVVKPVRGAEAAGPARPDVELKTRHSRGVSGYQIKIAKKADADKDFCKDLDPIDKTVNVVTIGWGLEFSAGAVIDNLTDRKYFLDPADGGKFTVREDSANRDKTNQRLGLFAHLVNVKRYGSVAWNPLTLGLGFDDKTRYMIGTGVRIGDDWYVNLGGVFGKTATLPTGLSVGSTVSTNTAISTLGSRSDHGVFLSISFAFLGSKAKDAFGKVVTPSTTGTSGSGT